MSQYVPDLCKSLQGDHGFASFTVLNGICVFLIVSILRDSLDDKCAKTSGEEVGESDTEIDVVNEDPQMVIEKAVNETSYKKKPKSLKKTPAVTKKHRIEADESEDEDIIGFRANRVGDRRNWKRRGIVSGPKKGDDQWD